MSEPFIALSCYCSIEVQELSFLPQRGTTQSAGYDLRARHHYHLLPGHAVAIPCGFRFVHMAPNIEAQIRSRSGLALNHQVIVLNAPGTIDPDYRDEVKVILYNAGYGPYDISRGERIAQMVFSEFLAPFAGEVEATRSGGFGSTGHE